MTRNTGHQKRPTTKQDEKKLSNEPDATKKPLVLTKKEKRFVQEAVKSGDPEKAAEIITGDKKNADVFMKNENVVSAISLVMELSGMTDQHLVNKLMGIVNTEGVKYRGRDVLQALDMSFNLKGSYPAKKLEVKTQNVNVQMLARMSKGELRSMLQGIIDGKDTE